MNALLPAEPFDENARPMPATSERPPAVEVLSAEKVFSNGTRALAPIDLTIADGEFLTLIGPSGCGKSTLLKLIANLIEPSDGRLLWWRGGFAHVGQAGRRLAFVFQEPTLMPWARVEANVRLPLDLAGMPNAKADPLVTEAIAHVGLSAFARHFPRQLSGGMKMRVSIARALVTNPNLLLMDEPFGALDEFTRNKLDDDLVKLWCERKLTTVFVTHSIYEAVFLSTRIIVMAANPGRIFARWPSTSRSRATRDFATARNLPPIAANCRPGSRRPRCRQPGLHRLEVSREAAARIRDVCKDRGTGRGRRRSVCAVGNRFPAGVRSRLSLSQAERHLCQPRCRMVRRCCARFGDLAGDVAGVRRGGRPRHSDRLHVRAEPGNRSQPVSLCGVAAGDAGRCDRAAHHHPGQEHASVADDLRDAWWRCFRSSPTPRSACAASIPASPITSG